MTTSISSTNSFPAPASPTASTTRETPASLRSQPGLPASKSLPTLPTASSTSTSIPPPPPASTTGLKALPSSSRSPTSAPRSATSALRISPVRSPIPPPRTQRSPRSYRHRLRERDPASGSERSREQRGTWRRRCSPKGPCRGGPTCSPSG
ncbi:Protein tyrosine kinase [Musa troglodytarum]|nr:Protein tyrosine kinase [Musa troglodytarum]